MYIYIVRHGETMANVEGLMHGWTDGPLNENGIELAAVTGQGMSDIMFDACISSPLIRAKHTAEIILKESGNEDVPILSDDRIKEINLGEWEGKRFRPGECEVNESLLQTFFEDPFRFEGTAGGESIMQVCERTQAFLKDLLQRDDGKNYLVTTHGFALRAMLNFLYNDPSDYWHGHVPYNCAVNIVEGRGGIGRLIADDKLYYESNLAVDQYKDY